MPVPVKKNDKIHRERLNTTIDSELLYKAQALRFLLKAKGINMNGINEMIEEGLEIIIQKYSEENGVSVVLD